MLRLTLTGVPLVAVGKLKVVLALPLLSNTSSGEPSAAAEVLSVAVWPSSPEARAVQGLELLAQALTVTVLPRQAMLVLGNTTS